MQICYRCDDEINKKLKKESGRMELTKQALIDNIIRDYFKVDHKDTYVISEKKIKERERKRSREVIEKLKEIVSKFDELTLYMDRIFDTRWAKREESEEFRRIVVSLLINIGRSLEDLRKDMKS